MNGKIVLNKPFDIEVNLGQLRSDIKLLQSSKEDVTLSDQQTKVITMRMTKEHHRLIKDAAHNARLSMNRFVLATVLKEVLRMSVFENT